VLPGSKILRTILCPIGPHGETITREISPHGILMYFWPMRYMGYPWERCPPWKSHSLMGITCGLSHVKKISHGRAKPMWIFPLYIFLPCKTTAPSYNHTQYCLALQIYLPNVYPNPRPNRWMLAVLGGFLRFKHQ